MRLKLYKLYRKLLKGKNVKIIGITDAIYISIKDYDHMLYIQNKYIGEYEVIDKSEDMILLLTKEYPDKELH